MLELGQLEKRAADFAQRNTRIIAMSIEGLADAAKTQADFPHLVVLSDEGRGLSNAAALIQPDSNPAGGDTATPTTILVDGSGSVRWLFRPDAVMRRLSADEVLQAIDQHMRGSRDTHASFSRNP
jgi:peroxiredoxin